MMHAQLLGHGVKNKLRAKIEAALRRLPVLRSAYAERDALKVRLLQMAVDFPETNALLAVNASTCANADISDAKAMPNINRLDPHQLESMIPLIRTDGERIQIAARCRDADCVPKVDNAGAVIDEPDGTRVQIMHNGIRVLAGGYYGDWMQDLISRCKGHHEPQEERVFHEILKHIPPAATMIELGGYWSFYSIWFLSQGDARRSLVVEPDPARLDVGRTNARLNRCTPEFIQAFASRNPTQPTPFQTETSGTVHLPGVSVSFLMETRGISHLDILHCDCQGIELEVLESCRDLFVTGRIGWVVVSTHSHHISGDPLSHQRCLAVLVNAGAMIVAEHDVQESFSGDGLIVAKFGSLPQAWQRPRLSYNRYSQSLFRNPLYDFALARTALAEATPVPPVAISDAGSSKLTERDVASFLKRAGQESRNRLFDAFGEVGLSDYLYVKIDRTRFLVNARDQYISRGLFVSGNADFNKFEIAVGLLKQRAHEAGTIDLLVDVGANIGSVCIPAVMLGFVKRAIAIEPEPTNCRLLQSNIAINGLLNQIEVVARAASARDDAPLIMELSKDNWGDHRISHSRTPGHYGEAERAVVAPERPDTVRNFRELR